MGKTVGFLVLAGFLASHPAWAGQIQVCRPDYMDPKLNQRPLAAPAGIVFDDWGDEGDAVITDPKHQTWDLHLVTTAPFKMKAGQKCTTVSAAVTASSKRKSVRPADHRHFEPGDMVDEGGRELEPPFPRVWDWISQTEAKVVSEIR